MRTITERPLKASWNGISQSRRALTPNAGVTLADLPRWPFTAMFALFPLWWALGPGEAMWIPLAAVMVYYLLRRGSVAVPRGFGIWLLFLIWMLCSVVEIDTGGRLIGFVYRALLYVAVTVIYIYIYNARSTLSTQYVLGVLTIFWLVVVAGGFLGAAAPLLTLNTPLGYVLPPSISSNDLVHEMIQRRVTQFNPEAFNPQYPRPSAPFLYTNGWGNVFSMLTPLVVAYMLKVRHRPRFWFLLVALLVSFIPAFLTLNRGMLIGLAIALVYVTIRSVMRGHFKVLLALLCLFAVVGAVFVSLPITEHLTERVSTSSTTQDRANLYEETFTRTLESPLFGFGAPRPSEDAGIPSAGTQGQVWMVMFSFGFPGLILFMGWFLWMYLSSLREHDPIGLACNTALLVVFVESFYYGLMTSGLALAMIAGALVARRHRELKSPPGERSPYARAPFSPA